MKHQKFDSLEDIKKIVVAGEIIVVIETYQKVNISYADLLKRKHRSTFEKKSIKKSYRNHPIEYTKVVLDDFTIYIFDERKTHTKFNNIFDDFVKTLNHSGVFSVIKTYTSINGEIYNVVGVTKI